jgi:outer membrane protein OmpA-like peptidoglycan-associated protein
MRLLNRFLSLAALSLVALAPLALAQQDPAQQEPTHQQLPPPQQAQQDQEPTKVEGIIVARSGNEIIVEYMPNTELAFLLDDNTKVSQTAGLFNARRTDKSMAALIPGLKVKIEGIHNGTHQLTATKVDFTGDALKAAQVAQASNRQANKQLQDQNAELQKQADALKQQNEEQQAELAQHKQEIDAAVARFGQMDDYYILDEVTVYFRNGQTKVDPKYNQPLMDLVAKAQHVNGYMIEVVGYASSAGSVAVNQRLSEDRADNVTNILLQQGHVPMTRMLAPGAMGESDQVNDDKGAEKQAENRRVVVHLLQNKAVSGVAHPATASN